MVEHLFYVWNLRSISRQNELQGGQISLERKRIQCTVGSWVVLAGQNLNSNSIEWICAEGRIDFSIQKKVRNTVIFKLVLEYKDCQTRIPGQRDGGYDESC